MEFAWTSGASCATAIAVHLTQPHVIGSLSTSDQGLWLAHITARVNILRKIVPTYGVGTESTTTGVTKTLNNGTGEASRSTTVVNIGLANADAGGATVVNTPMGLVRPMRTSRRKTDLSRLVCQFTRSASFQASQRLDVA